MLFTPGAEYVSAFVTHAVFPKQSWKKCQAAGVFHKFWYTDSCPTTAAELKDQPPFELISLAPHIAETLLREDFRQ
jgi:phosphoribosylpyrophosphate synthetase